jgi:acetyl-CoA carboxylase biotin carboxylase subunit
MRRALDEYFIGGIKTNLPLFRRILDHPDFTAAKLDTGFLDRLLAEKPIPASGDQLEQIAAVGAALFAATAMPKSNGQNGNTTRDAGTSVWKRAARTEGLRSS